MNVTCPGCTTRYSVEDNRIPPSGVTIECPKCKTTFVVRKDEAAVALPGRAQQPVALPGQRASAVPLPGRGPGGGGRPADDLDLGLDLDDLSGVRSKPSTQPPSRPPPRSNPSLDSGALDFIDDTAQRAKTRAPGGANELRIRRLSGQVEGPYGVQRIGTMLRAGDLEGSEEFSEDGRTWRPLTQHLELGRLVRELAADASGADLPGLAMPRDLPGPAMPRDLPGPTDPRRNLPAPAELPDDAWNSKRPSTGSGPALALDDDMPPLDLDNLGGRGGSGKPNAIGGASVKGFTAEEAAQLSGPTVSVRGGPAGGAAASRSQALAPGMVELGEVPKAPTIWDTYRKPIIAFGVTLFLVLTAVITEVFTPIGAFGYKAVLAAFEPPAPPPPPPPPPPPVKTVAIEEVQKLVGEASFEAFREVAAAVTGAARTTDNALLLAKARGFATLLYGESSFPRAELETAVQAASAANLSETRLGSSEAAKHELTKARAAQLLVQRSVPEAIQLLEPAQGAASDDAELGWLLGQAYAQSGRTADALRVLDQALVADAHYAPVPLAIARIVASEPDGGTAALVWYEKAAAAQPTFALASSEGAAQAKRLNRPGQARRLLAAAATAAARGVAPEARAALNFQAALAFADAERVGEAVGFATEAARLEPANLAYAALAGRALVAAGKASEAAALLVQPLTRGPDDPGLLLARAEANIAVTEVPRAFEDVTAAKRRNVKAFEPYLVEGRVHRQLAKLADARSSLTLALANLESRTGTVAVGYAPSDPLVELGRIELSVGNVDAAHQLAERAVKLDPHRAIPQVLLGDTQSQRAEFAASVQTYRRALELDPDVAGASNGLATALRNVAARSTERAASAEFYESVGIYLESIAREPKNAALSFEYGRALELEGLHQSALDLYRDAVALDESDIRPLLALTEAFLDSNPPDVAQAKGSLARAEKISPNAAEVLFARGRVAFEEHRFDDAQRALDQALKGEPNNAEYHYWQGQNYEALDSLFEAVREYEKTIEINSRHARAYRGLGNASAGRNRFEDARRFYEKYRESAPEDFTIDLDIAQTYSRVNRDDDARPLLERVLSKDAKNADALLELGNIFTRRGDEKGAASLFRRAAQSAPERGETWCALGLALGIGTSGGRANATKEAREALERCAEASNSPNDLKDNARRMLDSLNPGR